MAKKKSGQMFTSKYDDARLTEMIEAGKTANEIQEALGIASKQSLRQHLLKWMHTHQKYVEIPGLYTRNFPTPCINYKHELRMTKRMLEPGKFQHNDRFEIKEMTNSRIVLCRIGAEVEEEAELDPEVIGEDQ